MATLWDFLAWLWFGLMLTFLSWWAVGEFVHVYWLPLLSRARWMLNTMWLSRLWAVAYVLISVSAWLVWKNNGFWTDAGAPLSVLVIVASLCAVWHITFFRFYRIQFSAYVMFLATAFSIVGTVWSFILGTLPGVLMLVVTFWLIYVSAWNLVIARLNVSRGKVRRYGTKSRRFIIQHRDAGYPPPQVWNCVGREAPYINMYNSCMKKRAAAGAPIAAAANPSAASTSVAESSLYTPVSISNATPAAEMTEFHTTDKRIVNSRE